MPGLFSNLFDANDHGGQDAVVPASSLFQDDGGAPSQSPAATHDASDDAPRALDVPAFERLGDGNDDRGGVGGPDGSFHDAQSGEHFAG